MDIYEDFLRVIWRKKLPFDISSVNREKSLTMP